MKQLGIYMGWFSCFLTSTINVTVLDDYKLVLVLWNENDTKNEAQRKLIYLDYLHFLRYDLIISYNMLLSMFLELFKTHCSCCWVASVMSHSVRPHRWQPTRLTHTWDSPGKNTGVGCHFLLQCVKVKGKSLSRVWLLATPRSAAYQALLPMGFSRQEYWSGVPLPSPGQTLGSWYWQMP